MLTEVKIINYKSFLYETVELGGDRTFLLLGLNGQGKSNFYSALDFLFRKSPEKITDEQKRSLLHESLENEEISVQVTIDNSDGRFPVKYLISACDYQDIFLNIF